MKHYFKISFSKKNMGYTISEYKYSEWRVARDFSIALSAGIVASLPSYLEKLGLKPHWAYFLLTLLLIWGLLFHIDKLRHKFDEEK
jgi:hypothetical protein